jgi:hypothetical protein
MEIDDYGSSEPLEIFPTPCKMRYGLEIKIMFAEKNFKIASFGANRNGYEE